MSWTKRELILQAFDEIGLASYVFDLTTDQLQSALRRLDAMMAGWETNSIRVNYNLPSTPSASNIDDDSGLPDAAIEAVYLNLALRIAPSYGKAVSPETKQFADMAYNNLANQCIPPVPELQFPHTMPRGAGNKPWRYRINPFMDRPTDPVTVGNDSELTFN